MHSLTLKFPGFEWWWLILLLGLVGLLFFSFRKIPGGRSRSVTTILLVLRSLILILLAGLILKPEIHWTSSRKKAPSALVWIDNSLSIAAQNNFSKDSLLSIVQEINTALDGKGIKPHLFLFDEKIIPVTGKLKNIENNGLATDLAQVLRYSKFEFENENIVGALIISDGVITRGEDPTFSDIEMPFPVFTIGIGDSELVMDPAVTKIEMPQTVKAGDTVTINAEITPTGNGDPITVMLKEGEIILDKKVIASQSQAMRKMLSFQAIPSKPGEKIYSVEIIAAQDKNPYNNLRMNAVKVLESQIKILIVSGQANFEAPFLTRTLRGLQDVFVQNVVINKGQWLPLSFQEIMAKEWNLIILIGYPTAESSQNDLIRLRQKISDYNLPLIFFLDGDVDSKQLERLLGWNPIDELLADKSVNQISVKPTRAGLEHPLIKNFQKVNVSEIIWRELPPIGSPYRRIRLKPSLLTIIESTDIAENPVIAINQERNKPLALCIGLDFWRWSFMTNEIGRFDIYDELFQGMTKYLTDTLSSSPIQLSINKRIFLNGETVEMSCLLYDLKGLVVNDAVVKAELIQQNDVIASSNLIWNGNNYSGVIPVRNAGDCQVRISAWSGDNLIGIREQPITVVDRSIELLEVRQNVDLLRTIALRSGGLKTNRIPEIIDRLQVTEKIITQSHVIKFLNWRWTLVILIVLLTVEWSMRRFQGFL
ncbi:MAG TPA: hypothetical protein PKV46_07715 [Candidatus Marinimicrobia bacterium]|nr:hypothetical protein [Candidatus Neomarinimicrobiota bacterium]